ncbi:hypothetical protein E1B28_013161 [Marasmius oreades]|uniref:Uncharacterized protein n=1 Tax=Marasmius oreades TaxID=181124 RepID=A0A9P7UNR2_9AGAR|nr:uncharacterized protein E1B28_013161 [Marasmius oreades]KAG7087181.1 hypothetical protein E1B28_013161 [Marasmius oreades]
MMPRDLTELLRCGQNNALKLFHAAYHHKNLSSATNLSSTYPYQFTSSHDIMIMTPGGILQGLQLTSVEGTIVDLLANPLVDQETLGPNRACCLACGARIEFYDDNYAYGTFHAHTTRCEKAKAALRQNGRSFPYANEMQKLWPRDILLDQEEKKYQRGLYSKSIMEVKRRKAVYKEHMKSQKSSSSAPDFPASTLERFPPHDRLLDPSFTVREPQSTGRSTASMIGTLRLPPIAPTNNRMPHPS